MSKWTNLYELSNPAWLTKKTAKSVEAANTEIREMLQKREHFDQRAKAIMDGEESVVAHAIGAIGSEFVYERIELLERERRFRSSILLLEQILSADTEIAFQKAIREHQAEINRVYLGLLALGWPRNHQAEKTHFASAVTEAEKITNEFCADGSQVGRITPGDVMAHPKVRALAGEIDARRPPLNTFSEWFRTNLLAIHSLDDDFAKIRRQSLAAAGV